MSKTISIGFPIEYEDDNGCISNGLFLRENEVKELERRLKLYNKANELEQKIEQLQNRIKELEEINKQHQELNGILNQKINKAIECIEEIWKDTEHRNIYSIIGIGLLRTQLLNILQDKEEV